MGRDEAKEIEQIIRHEHVSIQQEPELKITLNWGQRGGYGWEIQCSNVDKERILTTIEEVDRKLSPASLASFSFWLQEIFTK